MASRVLGIFSKAVSQQRTPDAHRSFNRNQTVRNVHMKHHLTGRNSFKIEASCSYHNFQIPLDKKNELININYESTNSSLESSLFNPWLFSLHSLLTSPPTIMRTYLIQQSHQSPVSECLHDLSISGPEKEKLVQVFAPSDVLKDYGNSSCPLICSLLSD